MESIASNQSLDLFAQAKVITCSLDMLVVEAVSLLKKGHPYAVVLDRERIPQGLFNSQCLLSWLEFQSETIGSQRRNRKHEKLADVDLQPLPSIAAATSIDEFLARVSQYDHSASIWALVDRDSRYIGAIEVLPLVRQIAWQNLTDTARSLEQLRSLIEPLPLPLMIHNAEGHILGANQQWQIYLNQCIHQIPQHSGDRPHTYHCPIDGGAIRTWQVVSVELSGRLRGLSLAIAQNITNQEQLATELSEQNASLVRLNRMKDEFLACITHELKTPLTSVIGMASLLETKTFGELTERQSRYVNLIHRSGRHLMAIVDNIVDLAKAETGQLEIDPVTIAIKQMCEQSIYQTQKLLQQNAWTEQSPVPHIQLDIDPALTNIVADSVKVQQMLVNLLSNAFKFSEDDKQPEVGLTVRRWEGWIAFTVWDRGIGIPEEKQHLIFQKFQQLENTLTRRFDGTGLGLVLTRHLARLHGGDVTFVSQVGVGSQFTILLPPIPPRSAETAKVPIVSSQFVLVVDNAAVDIDRLSTMLTNRGYRVAIARTGTEALEKARRLQPSLILLSPDLPVLSGWDVLALLKQDAATKHIRVAMMVSNGDRNRDTQQANDLLVKPIEPEHLNAFLSRKPVHRDPLTIICLGKCQHEDVMTHLQALGHRLLEADSVEQGEILTQIWHPNLVWLDCKPKDVFANLERIDRCHFLKSLPILIGSEGIDRCRMEFPKLDLHGFSSTLPHQVTETEVSRIVNQAVGYLHSPTVLVADFSSSGILSQSLQQYILMAGFHVQISHSHELILQQLQSGSVDALLVTLHNQSCLSPKELAAIDFLVQIDTDIPIIVVDGRENPPATDEARSLIKIATAVLQQPDAIAQLLPTLRRCLSLG
ncbi:ATP-binding protein [Pseudanabaena sp. PCC 6802]|uniref:ATP-binding protein n=1 Tax=Pseudanabaena sp. PCC 6802 TaxID=118173 RepID=UPI0003461771|nr:ATP-binding protein [Pseudanabaena sp. PCC 6802]